MGIQNGGQAWAREQEKIKESCRIILGTALGERAMRPDFGCVVNELVFEPGDASLCGKVEFYVRHTLEQWEPRISVDQVRAIFDGPSLVVTIEYAIRRTNRQDNLVYIYNQTKE